MSRSDRGGRVGDYEHKVLIWSRPRRRFGYFAAAGKVTRRPQAAKFPLHLTNPIQNLPPHPPQCAHWGTFPPRGRLSGGTMCAPTAETETDASPVAFCLLFRHGKRRSPPAGGEIPRVQRTQSEPCPLIRHGFAVPPSPRGGRLLGGSPLHPPPSGAPSPRGEGFGRVNAPSIFDSSAVF